MCRTYQLLLQNVARGLAGDTGSPRSHRLVKALAIPPLRIIAGEVKRQLSCAARGFAKTVCTHEQALTVLGAGFMKGGLLGIWAIVRKPVLGRTLRLHRLKSSYGGLDPPAASFQCRGSGSLPTPSASGDSSSAGAVRASIMR